RPGKYRIRPDSAPVQPKCIGGKAVVVARVKRSGQRGIQPRPLHKTDSAPDRAGHFQATDRPREVGSTRSCFRISALHHDCRCKPPERQYSEGLRIAGSPSTVPRRESDGYGYSHWSTGRRWWRLRRLCQPVATIRSETDYLTGSTALRRQRNRHTE